MFVTTESFAREHEEFDLVVCGNCKKEFHCSEIKAFGLFARKKMWILYAILLVGALLVFVINWFR